MNGGKVFLWALAWGLASGMGFHAIAGPSPKPKPSQSSKAAQIAPPANKLDTAAVRRNYLDGDFDLAIESLEDALKYGGPFSHQDSIFIMKHLGVMHTAKYETREKGKRYLMVLLSIEPTAKILDMYASDMIYMIFKNLRDEFEARNPHLFAGPMKNPQPVGNEPDPDNKPKKSRAWIGWTAAGAVTGGALLTLYLVTQDSQEPKTVPHVSKD